MMFVTGLIFLGGCGQPPDTDVTSSPEYHFSSFSGTTWKTKVKVALADVKPYNGEHSIDLLAPIHFDETLPDYTFGSPMQIITVLPVGTRRRIGQLMQDNGEWGGLRVTATLVNVTNSEKSVYLDEALLALNPFLSPGSSSSAKWAINPDMLEKP
jgi:hypothetical protein